MQVKYPRFAADGRSPLPVVNEMNSLPPGLSRERPMLFKHAPELRNIARFRDGRIFGER